MHVLILPSWYRTESNPLLGSFFREQALALAERGNKVTVIYPVATQSGPDTFILETENNLRTVTAVFRKSPMRINRLLAIRACVRAWKRFLLSDKPDIIHAHSFTAGVWARALSRLFKVPYLVTEHATLFARGNLNVANRWAARFAFGGADRVIAVSTGLAERIAPYCGSNRPVVIPNMVSDIFFKTPEIAWKADDREGPLRFLSVGYLEHKKGFDLAIMAVAELVRKGTDVQLTIGGDGAEMEPLHQLSVSMGVDKRVILAGRMEREEVRRQLLECDAFVLPSRIETFGIVAIEALACGRPVVMTDTDAAHTIVNESNGIVVPREDYVALAGGMSHVMERLTGYDPVLISNDCAGRFSESAVCELIQNVYKDVTDR